MKQSNRLVIKKLFKKIITLTENRYSKLNHNHDTSYVKKTGDIMNKGPLEINSPADDNIIRLKYVGTKGSPVHNDIALLTNIMDESGLYSYSRRKWFVRVDSNGNASFNGIANTALNLSPTRITNNTNLNNITTIGEYCCWTDATAISLANCPLRNAFAMRVFRWSDPANVIQEITQYNPGINKQFVRSFYTHAGRWGAWMEIINSGNFRDYFTNSIMFKSTSATIAKSVEITEMGFYRTINTLSITGNKTCRIIPYRYGVVGSVLKCFSINMNGGIDSLTLIVHNHGLPTYKNICISGSSVIISIDFLAIPE